MSVYEPYEPPGLYEPRARSGSGAGAGSARRRLRALARRAAVLCSAAALLTVPLWPAAATGSSATNPAPWQGSWAASVQPPADGLLPSWSREGFERQTVRQVVRVSAGGTGARFALSNRYGDSALRVAGATVARTDSGAAVREGTTRPLTFDKRRSVSVPQGGELFSDAVPMRVKALESLTVTLYLAAPTGPATYHMTASATSYRADGDQRADERGTPFKETSQSWYYLAGVQVRGGKDAGRRNGVVTFGDSITDGFGSTVDADGRYPDALAELLAARGHPRSVLNHGISGNMITTGTVGTGESGVDRFKRDALAEPRVNTVVVLEGINDIGLGGLPGGNVPDISVAELKAAHTELAAQARAAGLAVIGATLLPYEGAPYYTEQGEKKRQALNHWLRTSAPYDKLIDLDKLTADPTTPTRLAPAYDSGDHLHPNDTGYAAMAKAVARAIG